MFVSGAGKNEALRRLIDPESPSTPARLVQPASDVLILAIGCAAS